MSILTPPENRFDFFNVRFPRLKEPGIRQMKAFWLWTDINYSGDQADFDQLPGNVQRALEMVIAFFFSSDGIVFSNLCENFADEFGTPEIKFTLSAFETMELIHSESYGLQLDSIARTTEKKKELMSAISSRPQVRKIAEFAFKYMNRERPLVDRLVAFLCVEGIFFSSPFAFIFWLRKYFPGKMKGVTGANDLISRDENIHSEYTVSLINALRDEGYESKAVVDIFQEAVEIALEFAQAMLPVDLLDMNFLLMSRHIKSVANRWGQLIGLPFLYLDCRQTPFRFMENLSLEVKKNFFEGDTTEYQKAPDMSKIDYQPNFEVTF